MQKIQYFSVLSLLIFVCTSVCAQVYQFDEDIRQQGWYDRPYERYEAENGCCNSNAVFLEASDNQRHLQSEASHQQALQLQKAGDYAEWTVNKSGKGINIRFSLPDSSDGKGKKSTVRLSAKNGGETIVSEDIILDSYWAWQYTVRNGNYPDNTPSSDKMVRMRFDEKHLLLGKEIPAGSIMRVEKTENDDTPCTIDFVELESVPPMKTASDYAQYGEVLEYNPATDGQLNTFVWNNQGKTIYIPAGKIDVPSRIYMSQAETRLVGAGEWYTELYFSASSDDGSTYNKRGIEGSADRLLVEGFSINTANNKRYYQNNDSKQVGKGFQGGFGTGSVIRNCWVEHFECGGWIGDYSGKNSKDLTVEYCRFRNNYADGINLCKASTNHVVRHCSFRNNGDDDMASWSTGNLCSGCVFEYCTAENNWRASSLAFFGGQDQTAHHIAIYDALECGLRLTCDFAGTGFKTEGRMFLHDISIHHCGCKSGTWGESGDFWGNMQGALTLSATSNYDLNNAEFYNIDIVDSRTNAVYLRGSNGKKINNLVMEDISISSAKGYGLYFSGAQGSARMCRISYDDCMQGEQNAHMATFVITDCGDTGTEDLVCNSQRKQMITKDGLIVIENGNERYLLTGQRY